MNVIREKILSDIGKDIKELNQLQYNDLVNFNICAEYFINIEDEDNGIEADFDEVIATVNKNWLFDYIQKTIGKDARKYLQEKYTSEDSINWLEEAARTGNLMMIAFN